jgi:hypothetical protein
MAEQTVDYAAIREAARTQREAFEAAAAKFRAEADARAAARGDHGEDWNITQRADYTPSEPNDEKIADAAQRIANFQYDPR